MNKMQRYYRVRTMGAVAAVLLLAACQSEAPADGQQSADYSDQAVAFAASVVSSREGTRADASIVNLHETSLPSTGYGVGVFGAYTGNGSWSATATADFMFNQRMTVGARDDSGHNPLSYHQTNAQDSPERFWPNNGGKLSFWAYYPYNATSDPGEYGISITTAGIGRGKGMGEVRFTMHPNTSEQNDFMMSDLVADCTKETYPLVANGSGGYVPTPVLFRFHHLLAQVRLYAFVRGTDKIVYKTDDDGNPVYYEAGATYKDQYGTEQTVAEDNTVQQIDEDNSVRWDRTDGVWDVNKKRQRANITYTMSFNNIHTSATFTPVYDASTKKTSFTYKDNGSLGSATVDTYVMNPYWFRFNASGERVMLNDSYMYGYFEDTAAAKGENAKEQDGIDWSDGKYGPNALRYSLGDLNKDHLGTAKHYNYAPCNIILAVPQVMKDDDVPHVVITATGKSTKGETISGRVTINLLNMNLKWESGYIYSYAFIDDDMKPGDDKVMGPESITVVFDKTKWTDQW